MTSGVTKQDGIIVGCAQIRWIFERSAEIYPGIATEPVGGTGKKLRDQMHHSHEACALLIRWTK